MKRDYTSRHRNLLFADVLNFQKVYDVVMYNHVSFQFHRLLELFSPEIRHRKLFENLAHQRTTSWGIDGYALSFNYVSDVFC
jgi:hypothetical protein